MKIKVFCMLLTVCLLNGCMSAGHRQEEARNPILTKELDRNDDGVPVLNVYINDSGKIERMDLETYLIGVVAGEMPNDWPMEALKAQAILARTFTMQFLQTKTSQYKNADISTDTTEAQAFSMENINDRVRQAVEETRGMVMTYQDHLPMAWFHAHSGGITELPDVALEYPENPDYLSVVSSPDSEKAPEDVRNWTADFNYEEIVQACRECGVSIDKLEAFEAGERGESGRVRSFLVNGQDVSAPSFRISIGSSKLRSTLIDEISLDGKTIHMEGRGYGHGVGMSQWGAYAMAENGATAQTIIEYYFKGIGFADMWE